MKLPNFFIVGAPKCGTTSMAYYLKQHPEVFVSAVKEPHFFGTDFYRDTYIRDRQRYLDLFSPATSQPRRGEASVWYLYSKRAATEIREFAPDARILIMLRNPVDLLYSLHTHQVNGGKEDILDFKAALEAEPDRKKGLRLGRAGYPAEFRYYREVVKFSDQVQRYVEAFGWGQVKVILQEDLKEDSPGVFRDVCDFLGVSRDAKINFSMLNPGRRLRSKMLLDAVNNAPRQITHLLPQKVRTGLQRFIRAVLLPPGRRSDMESGLRASLVEEFAPEIQRLSKVLGRDLTSWLTPTSV